MKRENGRQSAPGADSWHLESASNLPDSCKDVRDAKRSETEREKSSENEESRVGRKNGRTKGNVPRQEGGQSKRDHATAYGKVRSDTRGPVRRMREHARLGARRERDVTKPGRSRNGSWKNELCCETVDGGGGNEPDPQETRSRESHAMSRCEQPG